MHQAHPCDASLPQLIRNSKYGAGSPISISLSNRRFVDCRWPQSLICTVSTRTGALSLSCVLSNSGSASDGVKTRQTCATCHHSTVRQPVCFNIAQPGHHRIAMFLATTLKQHQDHMGTHVSRTIGSIASGASLQGGEPSPDFFLS